MVICIVTTLALITNFYYVENSKINIVISDKSILHFEGIDSIQNYWQVQDDKDHEIIFYPECKKGE